MLIKLFGAAVQGIDATIVTIEVNSSRGIKFFLVGLPDSAVKESHERIVAALQVNGYKFPTCQIVINMAPADIRKEGKPPTHQRCPSHSHLCPPARLRRLYPPQAKRA